MDPQISVPCIEPLAPSHAPHRAAKQGSTLPVDYDPLCVKALSLSNSSEPPKEKRPTDTTEVAVTLINFHDSFTVSQSDPLDRAEPALGAELHEVANHPLPGGYPDAGVLSSPFTFSYPFPPSATIEVVCDDNSVSVASSTCRASLEGLDSTSPASAIASPAATHDAADHGGAITVDPFGDGLSIPAPASKSASDVDGAQAAADSSVVPELRNDTLDLTYTQSADIIDGPDTTLEAPSTVTFSSTNAMPSLQQSVECGPFSHFKVLLLSTTSLFWLSVMSVLFVCNVLRRVTKKPSYSLGDDQRTVPL